MKKIIIIIIFMFLFLNVNISALSEPKVKMTAGGYAHTVALYEDGTVWCWGNDLDGYSINSETPVQMENLEDIIYVAAGDFTSAAIKSDGTLWMWGAGWTWGFDGILNSYGSYKYYSDSPYLTDIIDVSMGCYFTAIVKSDGTVWILGPNSEDDRENQKIPKKVEGLPKIKKVAASWYHAAFLDIDGNVWFLEETWNMPRIPQMVEGLSNITKISGGGWHFIALKENGTVYNFGENVTHNENLTPKKVDGLSDIVDIAASAFGSVAVKSDGTVWSWGELEHGIGDGKNLKSEKPVKVLNIENAVGISCGNWYVTVTKSDGSLMAWGSNYMGQLGNGNKINKAIPVHVCLSPEDCEINSEEDYNKTINPNTKDIELIFLSLLILFAFKFYRRAWHP